MSRRPRKSRRCKCYNDDKTPIGRGCPRLPQTCHFVHPDEPEWDTAESSSWLREREELSELMESGHYDPRRVKGITSDELEQLVRLRNRRLEYLDSDNMDDEDDFDAHYQLNKTQQPASVGGRRVAPVAFTSARTQVPAPAPAIPIPSPSQSAPAPISQRDSVGSHIIEPSGTPPRPSTRTPPPVMRTEAPRQTRAPAIAQPQPLKPKDPRLARLPLVKATPPVSADSRRALPRLSISSTVSASTPANAEAAPQPSAETSRSPSAIPDGKPKREHEELEIVQPTPRRKTKLVSAEERALWDERIRLLQDTISTRNSLAALPTTSEVLPFIHPAASDASTPPADDPESIELRAQRAEAKHAYETALAAYLSFNAWPFSAKEMEVQVEIERQQREAGRAVGELRGVVEKIRGLVLDERWKGPGRKVRPPPVLQEGIGWGEGNEEEEKEEKEEVDEEEMQMVLDPELAARLSPSFAEQSSFSLPPAANTTRGVKRRRSPSEEPLPPSSFSVPPLSRLPSRTTPLFLPDDEDELDARPAASSPQPKPKFKQEHKPKPAPPPPPEADAAYTHLTDLNDVLSVLRNVLVEREHERGMEVERLVGKKVRAAVRAEKGKAKGMERARDGEGEGGEGEDEDEGAVLQALEANISATGVQLEELAGEVGNLIERTGEMEEGVAQVRARVQREGEWEWRFGNMEARLASLASAHTSTERTLTALTAAVHAYTTSSPPTPPPPSLTPDPIPGPDALLPFLAPQIKHTLQAHAQPLVDAFVKNVQGGVKTRQANTYAGVWGVLEDTRRVMSAVVKTAGVEMRGKDPGGAGEGR